MKNCIQEKDKITLVTKQNRQYVAGILLDAIVTTGYNTNRTIPARILNINIIDDQWLCPLSQQKKKLILATGSQALLHPHF